MPREQCAVCPHAGEAPKGTAKGARKINEK